MEDISTLHRQVSETLNGEEAPAGRLRCLLRSVGAPGQGLVCLGRIFAGMTANSSERQESHPSFENRAVETYCAWAAWRDGILARGQSPDVQERVAAMRATGFCVWHGLNRLNMPICWLRPSLHIANESQDATLLLYHELCEEGNALADEATAKAGGGGPWCVVYDRDGLGVLQARRNAGQCRALIGQNYKMAETLVDMFYNRAGKAYVVNSGFFFWACWQFARPFLLPEVRNRLVVMRDVAELEEHIDREEMPQHWRRKLDAIDTDSYQLAALKAE